MGNAADEHPLLAENAPEASPKTAPPSDKLWTPTFVAGMAINFLIMANYFIPMVVVTDYAMEEYGAGEALAGMVASIFIVGALVSRLASGALIAKIGSRKLLAAGLVAEVVFSALYFLDLGLYPLMALRLVHGFSYGAASSAVGTAVTAIIPDAHKGEGVGYYMLSNTLGTAVGPLLGMAISQSLGIHGVFAGCVVTAVASFAALFAFRPNIAPRKKRAAASDARDRGIRAIIEPAAVPISISTCLVFFGYSAVLTFLTPFAAQVGLSDAASFFFVAYALAMFVSRLFTGKIFDQRGALVVMVPSFVLAATGFALIGAAPNGVVLIAGAAVLGFGVGTVQSCSLTIAVQQVSVRRLSYANSTFYAMNDLGVGLGPLVLGLVIPALGYRGLYLTMAGVVAVAFAWYLVVEWRMRRALNIQDA